MSRWKTSSVNTFDELCHMDEDILLVHDNIHLDGGEVGLSGFKYVADEHCSHVPFTAPCQQYTGAQPASIIRERERKKVVFLATDQIREW